MANHIELLAVKIPAELAKAIKAAERATGANRSEVARAAITIGLQPAVTRLLEENRRNRDALTISAK